MVLRAWGDAEMKLQIDGQLIEVGLSSIYASPIQHEITIRYSTEEADDEATFCVTVSKDEAIEMAKHLYKQVTITIEVNE